MVDAAQRCAEARGLGNVEFRVTDAQAIDLPDSTVDAVLSRFGVMLAPEPARVEAKRGVSCAMAVGSRTRCADRPSRIRG
jgi:ubiquinone/menaquinone biosynthesis C-methylase UbiE